jgi:predicted membrane-bound spermidine synthase
MVFIAISFKDKSENSLPEIPAPASTQISCRSRLAASGRQKAGGSGAARPANPTEPAVFCQFSAEKRQDSLSASPSATMPDVFLARDTVMQQYRFTAPLAVFFAIFILSGFSGLIYESIWSHYLKLFLGHAAYAQALVLAIFMGGMAAGSALAARFGPRLRNALLAYALTEAAIGLMALVFHRVFVASTDWAYDNVIGALGTPLHIELFKWSLAALLILPQSILLGATFPLMSSGLLRRRPDIAGYSLAMLYFTNSLGASLGVLASGFVLIAWVGLPGTVFTAGLINILVAMVVWLIARGDPEQPRGEPCESRAPAGSPSDTTPPGTPVRLLLYATFLSSAASFFYEIGWIRMLSMVLGSATHSFELMLSAFILGLALGGFLIRKRIDALRQPLRTLAVIQIVMGLLATLTIPLYNQTFEWMAWAMTALTRTENGYLLINLFNHGIAMLIMLPATLCAGMTLPLITRILLTHGEGEACIGKVYAMNTVGAIFGVLLAGLLVMPVLGLRNVVLLGAAGDVVVGLLLLARALRTPSSPAAATGALAAQGGRTFAGITALLTVAVFIVVGTTAHFDPLKLSSSVYRFGTLDVAGRKSLLHFDGATASVDVFQSGDAISIATNGKVDAAVSTGPNPSNDEATMVMAAILPMLYAPAPQSAAVIGFGSGYTAHTLLGAASLKQVDTIEIEPKMVEGARAFARTLPRVFNDPRSHIYINDAKTYFSSHQKRYDVIVAEPSNPWVSGVSSLFSREFYHRIRAHLTPGGVYVQWIQAYEINIDLVGTILSALSSEFKDFHLYSVGGADLILVASPDRTLPALDFSVFAEPELRKSLVRTGFEQPYNIELARIAGKNSLSTLRTALAKTANSDYYPVLDLGAGKARFLQQDALEILRLRTSGFLLLEQLDDFGLRTPISISRNDKSAFAHPQIVARGLLDHFQKGQSTLPLTPFEAMAIRNVLSLPDDCAVDLLENGWLPDLHRTIQAALPISRPGSLIPLLDHLAQRPCIRKGPASLRNWLAFYRALDGRDARMIISRAHVLLAQQPHVAKDQEDFVAFNATVAALALNAPEQIETFWGKQLGKHASAEIEKRILDIVLLQKGLLSSSPKPAQVAPANAP